PGDDLITIDASTGLVTINGNAADYSGTPSLTLDALGGDDTIQIISGGLFVGGIALAGGDNGPGSDVLQIADADPVVDLAAGQILQVAGGTIAIQGVETLTVAGNNGATESVTIQGYGLASDVSHLAINT